MLMTDRIRIAEKLIHLAEQYFAVLDYVEVMDDIIAEEIPYKEAISRSVMEEYVEQCLRSYRKLYDDEYITIPVGAEDYGIIGKGFYFTAAFEILNDDGDVQGSGIVNFHGDYIESEDTVLLRDIVIENVERVKRV